MVDNMGIGAACPGASTETIVRRHERSREGPALSVLEADRSSRTAAIADLDACRALHPELSETGGSTEFARRRAEYSQ